MFTIYICTVLIYTKAKIHSFINRQGGKRYKLTLYMKYHFGNENALLLLVYKR